MIYLLDVSAMLSLVFEEHEFHRSVAHWLRKLNPTSDSLASCSITELGVVRILPPSSRGNYTVTHAQEILARAKATSIVPFVFLSDGLGADKLPTWVKLPKQTTDGHLVALAKSHGATLATFDKQITGALVIPHS